MKLGAVIGRVILSRTLKPLEGARWLIVSPFTREHYHPAVEADFVPRAEEIAVDYAAGESIPVSLHDGSRVILRKLDPAYDPTDRSAAYNYIEPSVTEDVDILIALESTPQAQSGLVTLGPILSYLKARLESE